MVRSITIVNAYMKCYHLSLKLACGLLVLNGSGQPHLVIVFSILMTIIAMFTTRDCKLVVEWAVLMEVNGG